MKKDIILPLGENVLIKPEKSGKKTDTGIYLPESASEERPQEGKVVAIGDNKEIKVKKNQKVIFKKYSGNEIEISGEKYLIIKNEDILAVIS